MLPLLFHRCKSTIVTRSFAFTDTSPLCISVQAEHSNVGLAKKRGEKKKKKKKKKVQQYVKGDAGTYTVPVKDFLKRVQPEEG